MNFLESTDELYNYYLDVNIFVKKMIEFDIMKSMFLKSSDSSFLEGLNPSINKNYAKYFKDLLNDTYKKSYTHEDKERSIKNLTAIENISPKPFEKILMFVEHN